jgi:hypothetical protein
MSILRIGTKPRRSSSPSDEPRQKKNKEENAEEEKEQELPTHLKK